MNLSVVLALLLISPSASTVATATDGHAKVGLRAVSSAAVPQQQQERRRRRHLNSNLQCDEPTVLFFESTLTVQATRTPSRTCTQAERDGISALVDTHFDALVAQDLHFGPVELRASGPSCERDNGRRLFEHAQGEGNDEGGNEEDSFALNTAALSLVEPEDEQEAKQQRDLTFVLFTVPIGYIFLRTGDCRMCFNDRSDKRHRQLNTNHGNAAVFLSIQTDRYPSEMSYQIKTVAGAVVYSRSEFANANTEYTDILYLNANEEYLFVAHDAYGDGWCCSYGTGGANLYGGTGTDLTAENTLVVIDTNFGTGTTVPFTVPAVAASARSAVPADVDPLEYARDVTFPLLESAYSTYISFYLQQAYHSDPNHCLYGTYPSMVVDLEVSTEIKMEDACPLRQETGGFVWTGGGGCAACLYAEDPDG